MGAPLEITRTDHTSAELRAVSNRCSDGAQVRRILAVAMVLEGRPRTEAAELNRMDRQTLRDWVHRYNDGGIAALRSRPCENAWRFLVNDPDRIRSIGSRKWAKVNV